MSRLPLEGCVHRGVYRVDARNISYGVFDENKGAFLGIREKAGHRRLDWEQHWEVSENFGTVTRMEMLGMLPEQIKLEDYSLAYRRGDGVKVMKVYEPMAAFLLGLEMGGGYLGSGVGGG